jgi:hypothetical protein
MSSASNLAERIAHTVQQLPYEKQAEVFDFAEYLRCRKSVHGPEKKGMSEMIGIIDGPADLSANHDEIYD